MIRAHLLPFAAAFVAGTVGERHHASLPLLGASLACAAALRAVPIGQRAAVLVALALGALDATLLARPLPDAGDLRTHRFAATLVAEQPATLERYTATVRLVDGTLATALLPIPDDAIGTRFMVRGRCEPFDGPRNPGEPSPRELEAERGITWHIAHASVLARAPPDPRDASLWAARLRGWASHELHARLGEPGATILAGTLWGERGALPSELRAEFQDTGTVHVLVTAGLHLGVVAALALAALRGLGCGRTSASLVTIVVVWAYAAFSGAHLPSLRAATMLSFALFARAAGRDAYSWNALAAATIVVTALRPASTQSLSFALSFSCVAAIFAFARPLARGLARLGAPAVVAELGGVALATQLGTWPLGAAAFLVIAPYAPLANALVVPTVGVAMLVGFAELAVAPVPLLANLTANVEASLVAWIVAVVQAIASWPGAHVVATPPPPWSIVVYDFALIAAAVALERSRPHLAAALVAAVSALCLWPPRPVSHDVVITAIDVGQADALLIRTPRGHAFLVDAGGRLERGGASDDSSAEDVGTRVVMPFLVRAGVHHLDAVLLSHPHGDHAGGVPPVLRTLGANAFGDSGQTYAGRAYQDALAVVGERHVALLEPRGGTVWRTDDGVTFRFFGPTAPYLTGTRSDINSNSLLFRVEYGRFRMLFTGDAGRETEERLLHRDDDLRADVLKVGHHGSAYGTTRQFVHAVGATAAIISVGRDNLFGHPALETLTTLQHAGIVVHRTDRNGAVTVTSDGVRFDVHDFLTAPPR